MLPPRPEYSLALGMQSLLHWKCACYFKQEQYNLLFVHRLRLMDVQAQLKGIVGPGDGFKQYHSNELMLHTWGGLMSGTAVQKVSLQL